ncbi:MAG: response regulator [Nitrospirae bacterium YQR-1]
MRILIAEDDFAICSLLQQFLESYATNVDSVANGAEAVDMFMRAMDDNKPYDIVFLDVMMPEMDGFTALERIRGIEKTIGIAYDKEVKIVMATALNSPKDVLEAYYIGGCNDYIAKPFDLKKLAALLVKYGFSKVL